MDNLVLYKGVYITKEHYNDIKSMRQIPDEEIDYSDIPEITHEEFLRMLENTRRRRKLQQANQLLNQAV